jgi:hypothetical protein
MVSSWHNCFDDMLIVVMNGKYKLVFDDSFGFTDHVTQQIRMLLLGSTPFILNLWEWAIASHGRVLDPLGWLQVIFPGHGFKYW